MPDRTVPPIIQHNYQLQLPMPKKHLLSNGIPVHEISIGTQNIIKLEIVFKTGRTTEKKHLVARTTATLLKEGTVNHSSAEIAETIDFYGGTLSMPISLDTSSVVFYSLSKHFEKLLPLLTEIITTPKFPEEELQTFKKNAKQDLKFNLTKNDVVAYREITELIFGSDHPYGYNSSVESIEALTRADLVSHFESQYHAGNCMVIISGKINPKMIALLDEYLGQKIPAGSSHAITPSQRMPSPVKKNISLENSVQTAIRVGSILFNKNHEDYKGMFVLNTVLGGYFSSRLMMNIREDKGYTYNIFSMIDTMVYDGYFYIGTEVGNEFVEDTLAEIYKELERLQTELIPAEELGMVKSYLLGNMLTLIDGPMNVAEIVKTVLVEDLSFTDFEDLVEVIKHITAEELQRLAQKYFQKERMTEVIVGV